LNAICGFSLREGLSGMNFALGIPGTVGGAVAMNAGTALGAMQDVLRRIEVLLPDGRTAILERETFGFSYRKLIWKSDFNGGKEMSPIVLKAVFALRPDDPEILRMQAREIIRKRKERQPLWVPSAGCFFKNPDGESPAGMLIDQAGLKGKSVGGAAISEKHANFFINRENASAKDVLALMELVQETVENKFGIELEPEVKIVGD
jgi:UDP-N-acetylmuramate dehydrogenase